MAGGGGFPNNALIIQNQARMLLDMGDERGRAYPWDTTVTLTLISDIAPNIFGPRGLLIPRGTFNFGDNPNMIRAQALVEATSDAGTYILELEQSPDGVVFTPIGSVRFTGGTIYEATFAASRAINHDLNNTYGRIKCATPGANTLTLAFTVTRFLPTSEVVPPTISANFPFD